MFFLVTTRNQFALPQGILFVDFPRIFKGDATVWQRIDSAGEKPIEIPIRCCFDRGNSDFIIWVCLKIVYP